MMPDAGTGDLQNVKEVLELLGYTPTQNPAEAHIIWALKYPLTRNNPSEPGLAAVHKHLPNLLRHQFVNQFPGLAYLACKPELAKLSAHLSFLPRTFQMPHEYEAWQAFIKTEKGAKMDWIQKGTNHRYGAA